MMISLRRLLASILGTALAASLVACGTEDSGDGPAAADNAAFPVTVDHAFGSVTIEKKPERIVDLTYGSALEPFLAVSEAPVAATSIGDLSANLPWLGDRVTWPMDEDLKSDPEKVASLDPDLIIINEVDEADWRKFQDIAPTLSVKSEADRSSWHTFLPVVATVTGHAGDVEQIEKAYLDRVREFQDSNRGVDTLTYNSGALTKGFIYAGNNVFQDLGISLEEGQKGKKNGDSISDENISLLRGDILVIFDPAGKRAELESRPAFRELPAVTSDAVIWQDKPMGYALSGAPGPVSLDWLIDRITPQVQAALHAK